MCIHRRTANSGEKTTERVLSTPTPLSDARRGGDEEETETGCNTTGDRQGAEAVRRRDACWGLWCPVREGLLSKGEEARSDTELVLLPPNRLHPVSRTFLTDRALIFNPEKKRNYSPRQMHKYTALEMKRKMENKFNWSPVKLKH